VIAKSGKNDLPSTCLAFEKKPCDRGAMLRSFPTEIQLAIMAATEVFDCSLLYMLRWRFARVRGGTRHSKEKPLEEGSESRCS
jgi:hypothetical protein